VFAGDGPGSCNCGTPINTYYGLIGPRVGVAYSFNPKTVLARGICINYSRPRRGGRPRRARATAPARSAFGQRELPSERQLRAFLQLEQRRALVSAAAFFDSTLNTGFVAGRGTAAP